MLLYPYEYLTHMNVLFSLFPILISLLGYTFFFTKINNQPTESNFFISTAFAIVWLFCFTQYGLLDLGTLFFFLIGSTFFAGMILYLLIHKEHIYDKYITPGICVNLFFIIIFSYLSRHLQLTAWDEFSHWAPHAQILWANHGFMTANDILVHKSYPPGGRLFYYLFYFFSGYSEAASFLGQQLLVLASISTLTQHIRWKNWQHAFWLYLISIVVIFILKTKIAYAGNLYMDEVSGVYLGAIFVYYLGLQKKLSSMLWLALPMIAVSLFKLDIFAFVLALTIIMAADQWITHRSLKTIAPLIFSIFAAFFSIKWWEHFLRTIHTSVSVQSLEHIGSEQVKNFFMEHAYSSPFFKHFVKIFFVGVIQDPLCMILLFGAILFFILKKEKNKLKKNRILLQFILFLLGFLAYMTVLFVMYQFSFSQKEALNLASFFRYMNIYYLMVAIPLLFYISKTIAAMQLTISPSRKAIVLILIIALMFLDYHRHTRMLAQNFRTPYLANNLLLIRKAVLSHISNNQRIFLIWNDKTEIELPIYIMKNYLLPLKIYAYQQASGMINHMNSSALQNEFSKVDYVLVVSGNQSTWRILSPFIQGKKNPLVTYQLCKPFGSPQCKVVTTEAFLFKVVKNKLISDN